MRAHIVPLTLLVAATLVWSCARRESEGVDSLMQEDVYTAAIPVETLDLSPRPFAEQFDVAGVIEAQEEVTVSAEIADRVLRVHHEIGDSVRRGGLLFSLDDSEVRARIKKIEAQQARARTQLEWARRDLQRQEKLFAGQIAAERAYDDAQRGVDTAEDELAAADADLELAQVDLDRCSIRSPITGRISRRNVSAGEYVTPGTELYDVVATDTVKFVFSVAERDVTALRLGDPLTVSIDALTGHVDDATRAGKITAISPAGTRQTRTFRVELGLENQGALLLPGMSGRAKVTRQQFQQALLLPESAILRDDDGSYIFLANDSHARKVYVDILSQVGEQAVIASDIETGYDAIISGQAAVSPGSAIRVRRRHEEIPRQRFD